MGQAAGSIFGRIAAGEIPCHCVFENEHVLAFLDLNPLAVGHTLVIPKQPAARFEELAPEAAAELGRQLPAIARRIMAATGATAYNILQNNGAPAGQEVPYVHFHIIPRRAGDGLGYRWKAQPGNAAELTALAARMRTSA